MPYILAVDGGNTKTIALVAALDGTILGAGRGGCSDIYNTHPTSAWPDSASAAVANIEYAVLKAVQAAQITPSDLVVSVFNMAGADWPEDFAYLQDAMTTRHFGQSILVQNDALGVLHTGSSDNTGVSVVCGTGSATGARSADGRTWHSSFWQDQAQGGAQMSREMLYAIYRSELGIDLPTSMTQRVLDFYAVQSVEEVLHMLTSRAQRAPSASGSLTPLAQLAPILLDEAQTGDHMARQIVNMHGKALGNYALAAARRVGLEGTAFTLVLAGGVLRHPSPLLADAIIAQIRTTSPAIKPTRYRFEPIIGVLFTALEMAKVALNEAVLEKIIATIPTPAFFATGLQHASLELP